MSSSYNSTWLEQGSTPSTPGTGKQKIYPKTDGFWYVLDDAAVETPLFGGASTFTRVLVTGTGGAGYLSLAEQASAPGTPTNAVRLFTDASNRLSWIDEDGIVIALDTTAVATSRVYTFPDVAGTVLLTTSTQNMVDNIIVTKATPTITAVASSGNATINAVSTGFPTIRVGDSVSSSTRKEFLFQYDVTNDWSQMQSTHNTVAFTPLLLQYAGGDCGVGVAAAPSARLHVRNNVSGTNTVVNVLQVERDSTGTPAAGLGVGVLFAAESSTTEGVSLARARALFTTVTHASYASRAVLSGYDSTGERDVIGWGANNTAAVLGFYPTAAAAPVVQPATTGTATGFTAGAGTAVKDDSTFTGGSGATAYRISDVVLALKQLGLLAA